MQKIAEDMKKERMKTFVESIRNTGLILEEPEQYKPDNPYYIQKGDLKMKYVPVKPWTIIDE